MKSLPIILISSVMLMAACKTQQKPVTEPTPPRPATQQQSMTDEEKQEILQSEYKPPANKQPEKPPEQDMESIISLAKTAAELACEIKTLEYKISQGGQIDPGILKEKQAALDELNEKNKSLFAEHPDWEYYFNEHLQRFMEVCK